jgi:Uma2 family endonuclease
MATVLFPIGGAAPVALSLRKFDADDYLAMAQAGFFHGQPRVELIDGYIVNMSPAGPEHNFVVMQLQELFAPLIGQFKLWIQGTLRISSGHVYDPDFALLQKIPGRYRHAWPTPAEVHLIAEVADSSRSRDLSVKLPEYANAGIVEYWVADVPREVIIVHRGPRDGKYSDVTEHANDQIVNPLIAPQLSIVVGDIFNDA